MSNFPQPDSHLQVEGISVLAWIFFFFPRDSKGKYLFKISKDFFFPRDFNICLPGSQTGVKKFPQTDRLLTISLWDREIK